MAPADLAVLQHALEAIRSGDAVDAEHRIDSLRAAARQHPDALYVLGRALGAQRRFVAARAVFDRAVAMVPRHVAMWNAYGNLLGEMGEGDAAIVAFGRAVAIDRDHVEAWTNLLIVATQHGRLDTAANAAARAHALAPENPRVLAAMGALLQARGAWEDAADAFERALERNPGDLRSRHNLATALRSLERRDEALAAVERALADGLTLPQTATLRAHLLSELGRFDDAVAQYRAVLTAAPDHLDAQEALARLLPQMGRGGEVLDGYAAALRTAPGKPLYGSAIAAAKAAGDAEAMLRWTSEAEAAFGESLDLALARVSALTLAGERRAAISAALDLAARWPGVAGAHTHLAHLFLQSSDPAQAEQHALRATELVPADQSGWALLTVIWRLLEDRRERWLADYDRLVMPGTIVTPPGWRDLPHFLADAGDALGRLHMATMQPAEQSLRGGTQTAGILFDRREPVIRALAATVRDAVTRQTAGLQPDATHPFLRHVRTPFVLAGSWSVRLRSAGFHISHIHPAGWLSSALYIAVPPEIGTTAGGDAGKLLFGVPDAALGIDLPPRRVETPAPGRLVLFPSYLWHGTAPFESAAPRLTVAFDAVPA